MTVSANTAAGGPLEQEALRLVTPLASGACQLLGGLDALGDGADAESPAERRDRVHDRGAVGPLDRA